MKAGVLPTVTGELFPLVALRFNDLRPDVRIDAMTGPNPYLMDVLRSEEIDLMMARMPSSKDTRLSCHDEPIELGVRAGHPSLGHRPEQILSSISADLAQSGCDHSTICRSGSVQHRCVGSAPHFRNYSFACHVDAT